MDLASLALDRAAEHAPVGLCGAGSVLGPGAGAGMPRPVFAPDPALNWRNVHDVIETVFAPSVAAVLHAVQAAPDPTLASEDQNGDRHEPEEDDAQNGAENQNDGILQRDLHG